MSFKILVTVILLTTLNITLAQSDKQNIPTGLTASEWQSIQTQINSKSIPQTNSVFEQSYLKASNVDANTVAGDGGDGFGTSVAIDGDTLVIGAPFEDDINNNKLNSGAAYVFIKTNGIWTEQDYLKPAIVTAGDFFGYSVDISGDTLVIGAYSEDTDGGNSGAAYVFTRTQNTWSQQKFLKASNEIANDNFGWSVAIDGDTIVVGAYHESKIQVRSGATYVFTGSGSSWSEQAYLKSSNIGANDNFGFSVSISGDTAVIGAPKEDGDDSGTENDSGAVYVYLRTGTSWGTPTKLSITNNAAGDTFGSSVAISGDTLVVGAPLDDSSGTAYVFTRSGLNWNEQANFKSLNIDSLDKFGTTVDIDGESIIVGAIWEKGDGIDGLDNNNLIRAGAAYLFTRSGVNWTQQNYLKPSNLDTDDIFGSSVAISGNNIVMTSPSEDSAVIDDPNDNTFQGSSITKGAGAAYVFSPKDAIFSDGFEQPVVVKLFNYLNAIKSNSALSQHPNYDLETHSIEFYGHRLKLKNNYHKQDIVEIVKFWLHEVLIKKGLSGQYGLDIIFE